MIIRRMLIAVAVLALATSAFAASPQKPGKWQITMQMEIPGMPMKMPPYTFTHCVTEEDVKNAESAVPTDPKNKDCKVGDFKLDGNTVSWSVDCPKQNVKGTGKITYTEDSFDGGMKMQMGEQEMTTKYSGKWLGACKK